MYLNNNRFSMRKRRRRTNWMRVIVLGLLILGGWYVNQVVIPDIDPIGIPSPTPTRAPESYVSEAEQYLNSGKLVQAVEQYQLAIKADPSNVSNYITTARLQIYLGYYEDAIENLGNALLLNDSNMMAYALRGWAYGFMGSFVDAETSLTRAIQLDPNSGVPYAYLAEVYGLKYESNTSIIGVIDLAIENSRKAVDFAPNTLETHRARGYILELTQSYPEAALEYAAAIEINPYIADLHLALGRIYYNALGEYQLAVPQLTEADLLNPADPRPDVYLSRLYQQQGEYATAIQYAQQAIRDDPTDTYYYGNLGTLYYLNFNNELAVNNLRLVVRGGTSEDGVVVEPLPLDYGRIAQYFYFYGLATARMGDCTEALQIAQALQRTVTEDTISQANADEMLNICMAISDSVISSDAGNTTEPEITATP